MLLSPPTLPAAFFVTYHLSGNQSHPIDWWYDSTQGAEMLVRRVSGSDTRACQGLSLPCTDLVRDGVRWIIHPTVNRCCYLGSASEGCGLLRRDWMVVGNASYIGRQHVEGVLADEWDTLGYRWYKWWQQAGSNVPVKYVSVAGNEEAIYNRSSFRVVPEGFSTDRFWVPPTCNRSHECAARWPCDL